MAKEMTVRQFREFAAAVIRNLPEISSADAQLLIEEQERLSIILGNAFSPSQLNDFQIVMDGSIPWDEALEVWERIGVENAESWLPDNSEEWPGPLDPVRKFQFAIVCPGYAMSGHAAKKMLSEMGFRMATLIETTWFLCQWENFIKGGHYCERPIFSMSDIQPLVIDASTPCNPNYLTVVSSGEMHNDYAGRMMLANAAYAAIKPWGVD